MDEMRIGPSGRDDDLTRALREMYAPPSDAGYWDAMEARIMAHISAEADAWWQPFRGWVRSGIVAAAAAAGLAGVAATHARQEEARVAFQAIVETPRTLPQQMATETGTLPTRDATLLYVISP
ncbi:MAG: hypothetical protein WKG32_08250 [Gemmatimonadaceae bacterium]